MLWVYDNTQSLFVIAVLHAALTGTNMLFAPETAGMANFVVDLAGIIVTWPMVAVVLSAGRGGLATATKAAPRASSWKRPVRRPLGGETMARSRTANMTIRLETPEDYRETENMVREAFWDIYKPGCDEPFVIHKLRESPAYVRDLDFVACDDHRIVGMVMCPGSKIVNEQSQADEVPGLIIGVWPAYQNKGVGSALMKRALDRARSLGFRGGTCCSGARITIPARIQKRPDM